MITPGELSVGMWVTVHTWNPIDVHPLPSLFGIGSTETYVHADQSWCGDCLRVLAIELPYVAVMQTTKYGEYPVRLDTRKCSIKELSAPYVKALTGRDV